MNAKIEYFQKVIMSKELCRELINSLHYLKNYTTIVASYHYGNYEKHTEIVHLEVRKDSNLEAK